MDWMGIIRKENLFWDWQYTKQWAFQELQSKKGLQKLLFKYFRKAFL